MAIGLPCISTDCSPGGARELIVDKENGLLVPCNDTEELANAIIRMIQDRELAKRCGEKAHEIRNRVEASLIADRWLEFIGE